MQFITLDQRIAVENFEVGVIYTVTFTSGDSFTGSCIGIGVDFVAFQRTAPELLFCLTMATVADVASIDPLGNDIGKILTYNGTVPVSIKTNGSPILDYIISGNTLPGTGERTGNLWDEDYTGISGNLKYVPVFVGDGTFTLSTDTPDSSGNAPLFLLSGNVTSGASTPINGVYNGISRTTDSLNGYITIAFRQNSELSDPVTHKTILNLGSTALPYEPYGYIIPIISGGTITNIYIGINSLRKSLDDTAVDELSSNGKLTQRVDTDGSVLPNPIISYIDTPTIPTTDGLNIFDVDTTVKPSEVYLKYFSPIF